MKPSPLELQIASLIDKYTAPVAVELRTARRHLQALFPRGCELVFDNYNALVFAFGLGERATDALVSVAAYPKWITLFFRYGAKLQDPERLLQGTGSEVRSIRLSSSAQLSDPKVVALIAQSVLPHGSAFEAAPPLRTLLKSISAKQRPRRPALHPGSVKL